MTFVGKLPYGVAILDAPVRRMVASKGPVTLVPFEQRRMIQNVEMLLSGSVTAFSLTRSPKLANFG